MSDTPFYLANNTALREATPADDLIHTEANAAMPGDSVTETQYLGFNIPEANIHGMNYMWYHPNLKVVTGGVMVWQGVKRMTMAAEMFDMRAYMSDAVLANDLHEYRLDNSYSVKMIEPLRRFRSSYNDEKRGNAFTLDYEAVMPAAMFGDGKHLEQGMRVTGSLTLKGKDYKVDCFNVRDRSWAKVRPEDKMPVPPVSWMTGWFGEDLMFNCNLMDHAGSNPQVSGTFEIPPDKALNGGWVWRDGLLQVVAAARKTIRRDPDTFQPLEIALELTLADGRVMTLNGRMIASCPWAVWPNMLSYISLIRWEHEGRTGHGDCQDVLWSDFVNANQPR